MWCIVNVCYTENCDIYFFLFFSHSPRKWKASHCVCAFVNVCWRHITRSQLHVVVWHQRAAIWLAALQVTSNNRNVSKAPHQIRLHCDVITFTVFLFCSSVTKSSCFWSALYCVCEEVDKYRFLFYEPRCTAILGVQFLPKPERMCGMLFNCIYSSSCWCRIYKRYSSMASYN